MNAHLAPLVRAAEKHLSQTCPVMATLIAQVGACTMFAREFQPFQTLVVSIINQQLSTKAAATIEQRLRNVVTEFTPTGFLAVDSETLRQAGLSAAKVRYITALSSSVMNGQLDFEALKKLSDADATQVLTALPGIGQWTAEMFLIFGLCRFDVLSLGDAALQRSARSLFGENINLKTVAEAWRPYRSIASWYLWRHLN